MLSTLSGIITVARLSQPQKADPPILVTVYPSISVGIVRTVS